VPVVIARQQPQPANSACAGTAAMAELIAATAAIALHRQGDRAAQLDISFNTHCALSLELLKLLK